MKTSDHFWCIETVGKGIYKLSVYGKNPTGRSGGGAAEILLDDDDIEELLENVHRARRTKVIIG